jgi:hypothetical protein
MKYPVKILSTGETLYFEHRSRTNQLWHEFLMSGYADHSDFDQWERDGYPDEISLLVIRKIVQQERQAKFDQIASEIEFFRELDQLIRDILSAPVDWDAVRAEYAQQQTRDASTREASRMLDVKIKETEKSARACCGDETADHTQTLRAAE